MSSLCLAFYPLERFRMVPETTIGDGFANSFPVDFNNVSYVEDLMNLPSGISHGPLLDVVVAVFFNFHRSNPFKYSVVRSYLIHFQRVQHSIDIRNVT